MDFYNIKNELKEIQEELTHAYAGINPEKKRERIKELEAMQNAEGFWNDAQNAAKVTKEQNQLQAKLAKFESTLKDLQSTIEMVDMLSLEEDAESEAEVEAHIKELKKKCESLSLETLLSGKYDSLNAILTLHSGAGGTEAMDWTEMLFRMYSRYVERCGWSLTILDQLDGEEAGLKSITFLVEGENAYGYLKSEKGVHRLVRISPFDANKRRHTSFASLEVMPQIIDDSDIVIRPEELKIDTYRSSGAGGQHVNKTESAVRITHLPTGIIVACQVERSQMQNKEMAMNMLKSKLAEKREAERQAEASNISGQLKKIEFGSQIRSYVFCPYTLVKDHRTDYENGNIQAVMDGDLDGFVNEYLKKSAIEE